MPKCQIFNGEIFKEKDSVTGVAIIRLTDKPKVETKRHVERAGHEFFTKKGTIVTQYGVRATPTSEWMCSDVFINPDGSGMRKYDYSPGPKPMHVQVNSTETLGVGNCVCIKYGSDRGGRNNIYMAPAQR